MTKKELDKLQSTVFADLKNRRTTHEMNKREAFDGMRAYHQSELSHKKDAIEILKTILTSCILVFTGLLASVYTGLAKVEYVVYLSIAISIITGIAAFLIVHTTNKKIDQDNKRYRRYLEEYVAERHILALNDDLEAIGYKSIWIVPDNPGKTGFHYTKLILIWFGWVIFIIAITGSVIVYMAVKEPTKKETKTTAGTLAAKGTTKFS
jgi:hypothetical protein